VREEGVAGGRFECEIKNEEKRERSLKLVREKENRKWC
jgi:hypothetical protein